MRLRKTNQIKTERGMRSIHAGAILALLLLFVSGAVGRASVTAAQEKPATSEVTIDNFTFTPAELTIPAGTQVTWTNKDDDAHTVVAKDKLFKSKALDTGEKFSFTFHDPGTYEYICSIHTQMTGKIIVK
jgi:plastocyanin